jgi:antitoxin VapB
MTIATSRTFRSGNSEAVRLPKDVAYGRDMGVTIVRSGDVITIYPARMSMAEMLKHLDELPGPGEIEKRDVETAGYSRRNLLNRMIASQAIVHRATLVTMNAACFADIPVLKLLAW